MSQIVQNEKLVQDEVKEATNQYDNKANLSEQEEYSSFDIQNIQKTTHLTLEGLMAYLDMPGDKNKLLDKLKAVQNQTIRKNSLGNTIGKD